MGTYFLHHIGHCRFFGFSGVAAGAATVSKWLFFLALAIFAIFLILGLLAGEVLF